MEVVGESILSAVLEVLFGKLGSADLLKFARQEEVFAELEGWKRELRAINEVLDEAEEKQIAKLSVKEWVGDVRNLAYDMEDVLDEFSTELLRRRLIADRPDPAASTSKVRSLIPSCFAGFNPVSEIRFNLEMGSKIKEISRRLDDISRRTADLGLKGLGKLASGAAASTWQRPPSTSLIHEPIHGRDGDKKVIIGTTLKMLVIEDCKKLERLPEGIMHHASSICGNNICHLEWLRVCRCSSLKSIPRGDFPPTLETLSIWECNQLGSIPWKMLQHLTSLRELGLSNCPEMMSSLEEFFIPNLKILAISNSINNVRRPLFSWGLRTFTSLEKITIKGPFPDMSSFSDDWSQLFPTSLILLSISDFYNLKSIASIGLQSFPSLKVLQLFNCPELQSFVPKKGLPPTLAKLVIWRCPILKKRCLKYKGKDWPKIAHIPYVEIDELVQR